MKLTNKNVVENVLAQIELIQHHLKAVDAAVSYLSRDAYRDGRNAPDPGNLRAKLYDQEVERWRNLCMWGLTLDADEQSRIKAAVHDRLIVGKHVADWLEPDGRSPGMWFKSDEDEFRRMARDAFLGATPKD